LPDSLEPNDLEVHSTPEDGWPGWRVNFTGLTPEYLQHRDRLTIQILHIRADKREVVVDDDRGSSVVLRRDVDRKSGENMWAAIWVPGISLPPAGARKHEKHDWCDETFRFVIKGPTELRSKEFKLKCDAPTPESPTP
jgi:hypothetical protein